MIWCVSWQRSGGIGLNWSEPCADWNAASTEATRLRKDPSTYKVRVEHVTEAYYKTVGPYHIVSKMKKG